MSKQILQVAWQPADFRALAELAARELGEIGEVAR
jgi:hypothetical protein